MPAPFSHKAGCVQAGWRARRWSGRSEMITTAFLRFWPLCAIGTASAAASYIAVPPAMRLAVPEANPSLYLTLSLGITFPFNVVFGIPLYHTLTKMVIGA